MNNNKVSIATKPLVYSAFRYIENKVWNALAEYVDNAVQSFKDHIDILKNINPNGKLRVDINIDIEQDIITITDNAFGITNENYDRAFELANIPLDRKGLNEFGMGMKVSSIWWRMSRRQGTLYLHLCHKFMFVYNSLVQCPSPVRSGVIHALCQKHGIKFRC